MLRQGAARDHLVRFATSLSELARFASEHARAVAASIAVVAAASAVFAINQFDISTSLDALLDSSLPWRVEADRIERLFPGQGDDITVVIDGATPELSESGAASLASALAANHDVFASVERVNGGPMFDREGLLYQSVDDVRHTTDNLIASEPLLAPIASDPSLRGILASLTVSAAGAKDDPANALRLAHVATEITRTIQTSRVGAPAFLSWRNLFTEDDAAPSDWRQFIEISPKLDVNSAMPGARASQTIRSAARRLALDADHGVTVRISGSAPIADEELATLAESSGPLALAMLACMAGVLYLATRSLRAVLAIFLTISVGAAMTTAAGLLLFHRFNLVSIAFLPLFIGLSVDFCIQLLARCAREDTDLPQPIVRASLNVGAGLALAAGAIALAFFSFLPTSYRGVAELGVASGLGMLIAFLLCLTLFPALLTLLRARLHQEKQTRWLVAVDIGLTKRAGLILAAAATAFLVGCLPLQRLIFDFDPMHLRNPNTEAVRLYEEMLRDPETTPDTINLVTPSLSAAHALADRLQRLPQVGQATSLSSFIPTEQAPKLAAIANADTLLDFSINPFEAAAPPNDRDNVAALRTAVAALRSFSAPASARTASAALADELNEVAAAPPSERARVSHALTQGLPVALGQLRASLHAAPITLATLPLSLRREWVAPNGMARVEVAPKHALLTPAQNRAFVAAVRRVSPTAAGDAVTIVESGRTIVSSFLIAGFLSAVSIALFLLATLRSWRWVVATIAPILLAGLLTFATCAVAGIAVNLENMIALPLMLGIGVAFNIYLVTAWRRGERWLLSSNLGRGVLFSAMTTGISFAALLMSSHPGTASMGALLLLALGWIVATTCVVTPALLAALTPAAIATPA